MRRILFLLILVAAMAFGTAEARAASVGGTLDIGVPGFGLSLSVGDVLGLANYAYASVPVVPMMVAPPPRSPHRHMAPPPRHEHHGPAPMQPDRPAFRPHRHR